MQTKKDMKEARHERLVRLPVELWAALDQDAERCGRSATKQVEMILRTYYGLGSANLDESAILSARQAVSGRFLDLAAMQGDALESLLTLARQGGRAGSPAAMSSRALLNSTGGTAPARRGRQQKVRQDVKDVIQDARARAEKKRQNLK